MKKFTSLAFLAYALLFLIVAASAAEAASSFNNKPILIDKRNNMCPQKRSVLGKRTYIRKCPCALASANFDSEKVTGFVLFAQDECGQTTVTGFFSKGLDDPQQNNYTFAVTDDCGRILHNLGTLDAVFANGGTKPFVQKFSNFNLNCDRTGILLIPSAKSNPNLTKRTYCNKKVYKRDGAASLEVYAKNVEYSTAPINGI